MRYKIINRNFYHSSFLQTLQCDLEKLEVESVRMIKVVFIARSHVVLFLVQHLRDKYSITSVIYVVLNYINDECT